MFSNLQHKIIISQILSELKTCPVIKSVIIKAIHKLAQIIVKVVREK